MNRMSKSMSRPKTAAPGEAFNTVWYVEQISHAALSINVSMSAGSTDLVVYFRGAQHGPKDLMYVLIDGICLWILNHGWLTIYVI
jgi:hypothetical protein